MTSIDLRDQRPLDRPTAVRLGQVEYQRVVDALRALSSDDWQRPTDCSGWTVRDVAGHIGGMMWSVSAFRRFAVEQIRAARRAKRDDVDPVDAMTALQVERMIALTPEQLVERMAGLVAPAAAARRRLPSPFSRAAKSPQVVNGVSEPWTLEYLYGTILTRDTWLHRVSDLARAIERAPELDGDHDARIVSDVAAEWARRHGEAVDLVLTGPAGNRFRQGSGGPQLELDAIEFCRMLSGRAQPTHALLSTQVPF